MSRWRDIKDTLLRRAGGLTRAAGLCGTDHSNLSNVLAGKRRCTPERLRGYCLAMGASEDEAAAALAAYRREFPDTEMVDDPEPPPDQDVDPAAIQQVLAAQRELIEYWRAAAEHQADLVKTYDARLWELTQRLLDATSLRERNQVLEAELRALRERVARLQRRTPRPELRDDSGGG